MFNGTVNGVLLHITISPQGGNSFQIKAGRTGVDPSGSTNPARGVLTIGTDTGTDPPGKTLPGRG